MVMGIILFVAAAFKAGKIQNNPFAPGGKGAAIPPPVMPGKLFFQLNI